MIRLEKEDVIVADELFMHPLVKKLYATDKRNESKPYFKKCMKYIFLVYSRDSGYFNMPIHKRKSVAEDILEISAKEIESNKLVTDVIKLYTETLVTQTERLYLSAEKRVDEAIEWLNTIPLKLKVKKKVEVDVNIPGTIDVERKSIMIDIDVDNSDEVKKALVLSNLLTEQLDTLKKKIVKEKNTKNDNDRIFDNLGKI